MILAMIFRIKLGIAFEPKSSVKSRLHVKIGLQLERDVL